jgi:gamma-glutamyltranspeptidase/glutathione hydrolase
MASDVFGRVPWAETLTPSVDLARNGFRVTSASAYYLGYSHELVFGWDPEASVEYHRPDGSPVQTDDLVTNVPLAATLEALGSEGVDLLYRGALGEALVQASQDRGGLITDADLRAYAPIVREPLQTTLHGWHVATNAAPAVGGVTVAALVSFLEHLGVAGWSARDVAAYASAQHAVFSFRRLEIDGDTDRFAAANLLMEMAAHGDLSAVHRSPSTVHVSAVDETGLGCAITSSAGYGSGAVVPGTGFNLNNCLGEIELTTEGLHALRPGQRLLSNMAPTVARSPDGETLAIGSPGADRITSAIASVLLNHIVGGMPLVEAVAAPRMHAEMFDGAPTLAFEPGVDTSLVEGLALRELSPLAMYFGGVQVASVDASGEMHGAADPRRAGSVVVGGRRGS